MARGICASTLDRIAAARRRDPMGIGPLLGEYAMAANMPASLMAEMLEVHAQTVVRWIFGQGQIQPQYMPNVLRLLGLLVWMKQSDADPLYGTLHARRAQIKEHVTTYRKVVKGTSPVAKAAP